MLSFRPHFISFKTSSVGGVNSDGEPVAATEVWGELIPCRYETNTKTNIFHNADGTIKVFPYVVWLDGSQVDYTGKFVKIYDAGKVLVKEGQVQHCPFRQLNSLLYVE